MNRRTLFWVFIASFVLGLSWAAQAANTPTPSQSSSAASAASSVSPTLSSDAVLEQGKELFDQGQYVAALDKFMKVLRRDPQHPEARQYLRMVVDQLRRKPGSPAPAPSKPEIPEPSMAVERPVVRPRASAVPAAVPAAMLDEEMRQRVRQRQLLTLDLGAIPGVNVSVDAKKAQVEIKTPLLFADKTGGLKEEGIPLLDRVAAWLKTFGQQPIQIHCYPEELEDANGGLFLHRYAQLYGFFVDERKLSATRFIGMDAARSIKEKDTKSTDKSKDADVSESAAVQVSSDTAAARIVIVSLGGGALEADDIPMPKQRWLEFSVMASHLSFRPEEGDWTTIDLTALTRTGVKAWRFKIVSTDRNASPLMTLEGKGNLLKRVTWDGRDQGTGSFVPAGNYLCKLSATHADGSMMNQEITLTIQRVASETPMRLSLPSKKPVSEPALRQKAPPKPTASKPKPTLPLAPVTTPVSSKSERPELPSASLAIQPPPPVAAPAPAAALPLPTPSAKADQAIAEEPKEDEREPEDTAEEPSSNNSAIWKQVIQFDVNDSDLKPTLKASLERIGKTLEVYPLQKVRIVGFALRSEANAAALAKQRAERVRHTLISEYQVDAKRVIVEGGQVGSSGKVEISITN